MKHILKTVAFGATLQIDLTVTNCSSGTFSFEEALHTYFAVADIRSTSLSSSSVMRTSSSWSSPRPSWSSAQAPAPN